MENVVTTGLMVTTGAGDTMVFVKVRETYDLHTIRNKMSVIAVHTPDPDIIRRNWAGLLMNCKFYRPVSADVTIACASVLPVDPLGVGITEGDLAPEDLFNPMLYKACTNESFSQIESRILRMASLGDVEVASYGVAGDTAVAQHEAVVPGNDDFGAYYGLLSDAHGWRHAMPQAGLSMTGLKPLVHEVLANFGSGAGQNETSPSSGVYSPNSAEGGANAQAVYPTFMRGNAKPMPRIPTTAFPRQNTEYNAGFDDTYNDAPLVPHMRTLVGCVIVPPSRLHELYYRMVVEWTIEFSEIRTLSEIAGWNALSSVGNSTHLMDYDFGESKVITEVKGLACANVDMDKVM